MREENAFPVDHTTVPPAIMQEIEAVMPIWNGFVDLRIKKNFARAAIELPNVEAKVCGLVRRVLQPTGGGSKRKTDLNAMYVVGMLLWSDGAGGPYTQEQKKNNVLFVVPELGRCAAKLYEGVASHPTCVASYRRTLANTGRCSIHFFAHAATIYKQLDLLDEAEESFDRAMVRCFSE